MIRFSGPAVLLDIEGTTSSISFVYDEMFPFVRRELTEYLDRHWGSPDLEEACEWMAKDAGQPSFAAWTRDRSPQEQRAFVRQEAFRLMDADAKTTGLKRLQGMIWEAGFASGELRAHVYDDVLPAIQTWNAGGLDVRIYSSGSVHAQKLFFGHTIYGDLLSYFRGHYDTTTGPKKEAASYRAIADDMRLPAGEILFFSDVAAELNAARTAGLQTALVRRPGNPPPPAHHVHPEITSFADVAIG